MLLSAGVAAPASDIYAPVLAAVEAGSPALAAARSLLEADVSDNATGLAPADPEVEFGFLWGTHSGMGHRKDVSVSQQFDFPTVYRRRRALAGALDDEAALRCRAERRRVLLQAKEACIELIFANANYRMCDEHLANARRMVNAYSRMLEAGHTTRLEANKVRLALAEAESMSSEAAAERTNLRRRLATLCGADSAPAFDYAEYPAPALPADPDELCRRAILADPALEALRGAGRAAQVKVSLAKSLSLPKLSVGYQGEFVPGEGWQGVKVGLSLPLWENRRGTKAAQAAAIAAESSCEDAETTFRSDFMASYTRAAELDRVIAIMRETIEEADNTELLTRALAQGEISMLDYLNELEYMHQARLRLLEAERSLALEIARLTSHEL